ncbi:MAG: hypothetical protein ACE147_03325 [Candidatus Methylomirabilales bacterium]
MSRALLPARRSRGHPPRAGFTIAELLVASSILLVALLGIAAVLPVADMTLHKSGQISKAVSLAQEMIEIIKNDPFHVLDSYNGADTRNTATFPADEYVGPGNPGNFMGTTNLTKWKNDIDLYLATGAGITGGYGTIGVVDVATVSGSAVLRKVTVRVIWTEAGRSYQVELATLASGI